LTAGAALCDTAEVVERYVYEFKEISAALVGKRGLTEYDRVVLFLQGLPDGLVEKIYLKVSLDVDDPDTFAREGCFKEAVEAALAFNWRAADVAKIRPLGAGTVGGQPEERRQATQPAMRILQRPEQSPQAPPVPPKVARPPEAQPQPPQPDWDGLMGELGKTMQELRIHRQQMQAGGYGYVESQPVTRPFASVAPPRQCYQPYPQYQQYQSQTANQAGGMNLRGCRWCGEEGHIKLRCPDYQRNLAEGAVHHLDHGDTKTRMGPHGSGGPVVPLPEYSGMWQRAWVERERQRPESQMHQGGRIEDITEQAGGDGPAGKVRNLTLEEVSPRWETPLVGALTLGTSGIQLHAGEVRAYVAQESTSGEVEAWVEAKRTADDMEDTITVTGARDTMRKRQEREVSYPRAGGGAGESSGGRPRVSFDVDEEVIMRESPPMAESPGMLTYSPGPQE